MNFQNIIKIISGILGVLGAIFLLRIMSTGDDQIKMDASVGDFSTVTPLIMLAIFIFVIAISYGISDGVETPLKDGEILSANGSRWVGTGIRVFYILTVVAFVSMIFSSVKKLISR